MLLGGARPCGSNAGNGAVSVGSPATACRAEGAWSRRDSLLEIEEEMQKLWDEHRVYEADAPDADVADSEKFFATFPFPYMNGRLHLGHAFSLLKAEFAARFARLDGKKVLFPFGFHCTGMPIAAAAMKLKGLIAEREAQAAGGEDAPASEGEEEAEEAPAADGEEAAPGVFRANKSKVKAKTGGLDQYDIMLALGIEPAEMPKFTEPEYWLEYFPPLAVADLRKFGAAIDFRRSFITTDVNPYYDAFVRWQFLKLREKYLDSGKREAIFSPSTGQPCADHDRAEGEGVNPQEYTLIKLKVKEVPEDWQEAVGGVDVFLVAATLRPETMYGQTNCFVLPDGEYGFYRMESGDVFVCSERSAVNMCYQGLAEISKAAEGDTVHKPVCLLEKKGSELVGLPLEAPLAQYETIYALPMLTISMGKGTGVVTSVPAEAPDDFACLNDWKTRANWRDQFGVKEEWCQPFDVVELLEIPDSEYEGASAPYICEKLKIGSHKEKDKLAVAKKEVYMKGFYSGVLTVGKYAGQTVQDAKPLIKQDLLDAGLAARYFEPEGRVVARSGDECVVALCDQWYLKYSDKDWTSRVQSHVGREETFTMYNDAAKNNMLRAVDWLQDWACSRTFGLGTRLPWDDKWLIESLSDSTVYMAYYTIAHMLQEGRLGDGGASDGKNPFPPEALTEDVLDYVFCLRAEPPAESLIPADILEKMRREFQFWYPVDLRCSGKDLIQNHLTMSLFNHAAIWEDTKLWPASFYCNGHVMVDSEKMSKSKGNFLTLEESINTYSADATRIACADSGDGLEDANFSRETASKAIMRFNNLRTWAEDMVARMPELRSGSFSFLDDVFENEISACVNEAYAGYKNMRFSEALKAAWFDMENLRSQYSILTDGDVHADVIRRLLEVQMVVLSPFAPHFCEYMWRKVLGKDSLVVAEAWPTPDKEVSVPLSRKYAVVQGTLRSFRLTLDKELSPKKKKKNTGNGVPPARPTHAVIFVARAYKPFQQEMLKLLQKVELDANYDPVDPAFMNKIKDAECMKAMSKDDRKKAMPFAAYVMKTEVKGRGPEALELELPFDEAEMLSDFVELMKKQLGVTSVELASAEDESHPHANKKLLASVVPGRPEIVFYTPEQVAA